MSKLIFDDIRDRWAETGVSRGILFISDDNGGYSNGVAWNGLTSISEQPDGGEQNKIYADNIIYASLYSPEAYNATIDAYTYPDEFMECDGTISVLKGVGFGQQKRKRFGLCYRTEMVNHSGNIDGEYYKLHIVYNLTASPSEKSYESINDSPDAITLSWEINATPIIAFNKRYSNSIAIDTSKIYTDSEYMRRLSELETILYGSDDEDARLPSPLEVVNIMNGGDMSPNNIRQLLINEFVKFKVWTWDTFNFTTMRIPDAIAEEAEQRVVSNHTSETDVPIPGIGYKILTNTPEYCDYELVISDVNNNSKIYDHIKSRFKTGELKDLVYHDGGYSYICDLHANIFS